MKKAELSAVMSHLGKRGWKKKSQGMTKEEISQRMREIGAKGNASRKKTTALPTKENK